MSLDWIFVTDKRFSGSNQISLDKCFGFTLVLKINLSSNPYHKFILSSEIDE